MALTNARLADELNALPEIDASRQRLVTAEESARRRIERDLHDGAQQDLAALLTRIALARNQLRRADAHRARRTLATLQSDAGDALQNLRELASGIHRPRSPTRVWSRRWRAGPPACRSRSRSPAGPASATAGSRRRGEHGLLHRVRGAGQHPQARRRPAGHDRHGAGGGRLRIAVTDDGRGLRSGRAARPRRADRAARPDRRGRRHARRASRPGGVPTRRPSCPPSHERRLRGSSSPTTTTCCARACGRCSTTAARSRSAPRSATRPSCSRRWTGSRRTR